MAVNLRGVMLGTKHGIRTMLPTGGGAILNWSSTGGMNGSSMPTSVYSAAKAGVISFTKAAAIEYGTQGIRANAICPGFIETEMSGGKGAAERFPGLVKGSPCGGAANPRRSPSWRPSSLRTAPLHHRRGHPHRRRQHLPAPELTGGPMTTLTDTDALLRSLRRRHQRRPVPHATPASARRRRPTTTSATTSGRCPRHADVEKALVNWQVFSNTRSDILDIIKAGVDLPPGVIMFEDPPQHTMHRGLMSRVFTPRRMAALEDQVRGYCVSCLDPLVGSGGFDIIAELGAELPMRVIGMLLGIPEEDQVAVRDKTDADLRTRPGQPMKVREGTSPTATCSPSTSTGGPSTPPTTS